MNARWLVLGCLLLSGASGALAAEPVTGSRVGVGLTDAKDPSHLGKLRLTDPLVQQKYLNDPDMLRFLRATYSETCARGLLSKVTTEIKLDPQKKYDAKVREQVRQLVDSQRLWKMSTFELEFMFREGYLKAGNYCDCLMKELADTELVNPKKGMDALEKIPAAAQRACEQTAIEKTEQQMRKKSQ